VKERDEAIQRQGPPMAFAANWALKSPMVSWGTRMLAATRRSNGPPFQSRVML
jgi:hypothetical protein